MTRRARRRWIIALVIAAAAGVAACAGVLGLRRSGGAASFPHRAHVLAGIACTNCHGKVAESGREGPLHLPDSASCTQACHQKPHDSHPCLECHTDRFAAGAVLDARDHLKFEHRRHMTAASGNCMRCHQGVKEGDQRMRPQMTVCFGCHEHDRAHDIRSCDACHVNLAEEGTPPASHVVHDGDWIHEHGVVASSAADLCGTCHTERSCARCHGVTAPAVPARLAIGDPTAGSVHRAGFRSRHGDEARAEPGACSTCHQPERCVACHTAEGVIGDGAASPHPPGWVGLNAGENLHGRAARNDPASCAGCHGGAGESLCVSCHRVGGPGGNPHPPGYSSRLPLGAQPCRLCHPLGSRP